MKNFEVIYFSDGVSVGDGKGNEVFVKHDMFKGNPPEALNAMRFGVGMLVFDSAYSGYEAQFKSGTYDGSYDEYFKDKYKDRPDIIKKES